jgi:hypothetical protein
MFLYDSALVVNLRKSYRNPLDIFKGRNLMGWAIVVKQPV